MRRSPRFIAASCAAVVVGLGTAVTVASDLTALHRHANELGPTRSVIVVTRDVPLGATLESEDLTRLDRYEAAVPPRALDRVDEAVGRTVAVPLVAGAVVQTAHLTAADRDGLDGIIPAGRRAVRVTTNDGAQPEPGTVVDVLAAMDPSLVGATSRATLVASGAQVLGVDDGADDDYATEPGAGVTLLVTEEEAYDLAFAAANGILTLAVAPPEAVCCPSPEQ